MTLPDLAQFDVLAAQAMQRCRAISEDLSACLKRADLSETCLGCDAKLSAAELVRIATEHADPDDRVYRCDACNERLSRMNRGRIGYEPAFWIFSANEARKFGCTK